MDNPPTHNTKYDWDKLLRDWEYKIDHTIWGHERNFIPPKCKSKVDNRIIELYYPYVEELVFTGRVKELWGGRKIARTKYTIGGEDPILHLPPDALLSLCRYTIKREQRLRQTIIDDRIKRQNEGRKRAVNWLRKIKVAK